MSCTYTNWALKLHTCKVIYQAADSVDVENSMIIWQWKKKRS